MVDKEAFLEQYRQFTRDCAIYPDGLTRNMYEGMYLSLGLCGEAGEAAEVIKKAYRNGQQFLDISDREKLIEELGDALWYLTRLADFIGVPISEIIQINIGKLEQRMATDTVKTHD